MGNAEGHGVTVCVVTKITASGRLRVHELPTEITNKRDSKEYMVREWDKIVTSRTPLPGKGMLVNQDGTCGSGRAFLRFEKIPEQRLDKPFPEAYDYYN